MVVEFSSLLYCSSSHIPYLPVLVSLTTPFIYEYLPCSCNFLVTDLRKYKSFVSLLCQNPSIAGIVIAPEFSTFAFYRFLPGSLAGTGAF
jgi:hypothetical protein